MENPQSFDFFTETPAAPKKGRAKKNEPVANSNEPKKDWAVKDIVSPPTGEENLGTGTITKIDRAQDSATILWADGSSSESSIGLLTSPNLKNVVRLEKATRKLEEKKKVDEILAKKEEILQHLAKGRHWRSDGEDDPETLWLAGRGGRGVKTADGRVVKVAMVGLYPGPKEITHKPAPAVMVGPSGQFLDKLLKYNVDHLDDVYRTNLLKHYKKPKTKITASEKAIGKAILFAELQAKGIEYVICLGAEVYKILCKEGDRFSASKFRGIFLPPDKAHIPVRLAGLQNPAYIISPEGEKEAQNFEDNLNTLFASIKRGGDSAVRENPPYDDVATLAAVAKWRLEYAAYHAAQKAAGKKTILALDSEAQAKVESGTLEPKKVIMITTAYGNEDALVPSDLKNTAWTFLRCPNWEYLNGADIVTSNEAVAELFIEEKEGNEDDDDLLNEGPVQKRLNFVFNSETEEGKVIQAAMTKALHRRNFVAWLDESRIERTELNTPFGCKAVRDALKWAMRLADEVIMQHGHFDKRALETGINFDWDLVSFTLVDGEFHVAENMSELMIETLTLDENQNRGLKEICAKELGWQGYDIDLEMFKAEHDVDDYSTIPWARLTPYAIFDSAGTLLAKLKKERKRKKKWETQLNNIERYYADIEKLTGHKHSDPRVQTPEATTRTLNLLMTPLYRIKKNGMPVGEEGMKKVKELIDFYRTHFEKLREETNKRAKSLLGYEFRDPGSIDQVSFLLYGSKDKGGLGLEPFREPGKGGRLWSRLNSSERAAARGTGAIDAESFKVLCDSMDSGEAKDFVRRLGETRQIKSILDNFFADPQDGDKGFFSRIGSDFRMHTEYMPTTETLRFRSQPNLANQPKGETKWVKPIVGEAPPWELRNIITAEAGHILLCRDWSSAEVYLLMYRANDKAGLEVISQGLDFHVKIGLNADVDIQKGYAMWRDKDPAMLPLIREYVAGAVKDKSEIEGEVAKFVKLFEATKEKLGYALLKKLYGTQRDAIKPVTFGVPYGETAEALARNNGMSIPQAEDYIKGYEATYADAIAYLRYNGRFAVDFHMLPNPWGYLRNFSGRQRDDEVERQAFNLPLQHGVACLMNQALIAWEEKRRKYKLKSEIFLSLYDAIGWHIPEAEAQTIAEISHDIMSITRPVGPFDIRQIPTEGKFSHYWEGPKEKAFYWPDLNLV